MRLRPSLLALLLLAIACVPATAPLEPRLGELWFGELTTGESSTQQVVFDNVLSDDAIIASITLAGNPAFTWSADVTDRVLEGGTLTVDITLLPTAVGEYVGDLIVVASPAAPSAGGVCGTSGENSTTRAVHLVGSVLGSPTDDADVDGLPDVVEIEIGTDPNDADSDDDGLFDGADGTNDSDGDGTIDALDPDSDDDGLFDGTEAGITAETAHAHTDQESPNFIPDADPGTITDPDLADTDADGADEALEDLDRNGRVDAGELDPNDPDTDGDELLDGPDLAGCTDPLDDDSDDDGLLDGREDVNGDLTVDPTESDPCAFDTDGDGLSDGLESGVTMPQGEDTDPALFVADADPSTTTDPANVDTDGGTVPDGEEDANLNGAVDAGERDPNDPSDDLVVDSDGDGLVDPEEIALGLDPNDADTDDDGLPDGLDGTNDSDGDGLIDALDPDSDNDGIPDSVEAGLTEATADPDTDTTSPNFVIDGDPATTTNPDDADTDGDGLGDSLEDANGDGALDPGETDPANADTDGDGLDDGVEDVSLDGIVDADETDPTLPDTDEDGIDDGVEVAGVTLPLDDDSDDDGLLDGTEDADGNGVLDVGETDPTDFDTDADGLSDGLEFGLLAAEGNDTDGGIFVADADETTTTDPLLVDTDGGTVSDGIEDTNQNGAVDNDERDPNDPTDDLYLDTDLDGFFDVAGGGTDCDDTNSAIYPGAPETPDNGIDEDCNGVDATACFLDGDLDGFGGTTVAVNLAGNCTDPGYVTVDTDCDDTNPAAYPGAAEILDNGVDEDCSGADEITCFVDGDLDTFGAPGTSTTDPLGLCTGAGLSPNDLDCDDVDPAINPNAVEVPDNTIDEDCSGTDAITCFVDGDLDNFGTATTGISPGGSCTDPGFSALDTDCDDAVITTYPGAPETCNAVDDDCDGSRDPTGTCAGCSHGDWNGHIYALCDGNDQSWTSADTWCSSRGYYLTTINDLVENGYLWTATALIDAGNKWWFGFNDIASEGNFVWAGNNGSGYTNWHPSEPNNSGGNEDCAQLRRYGIATWNDEPCSASFNYICEAD